jgi:hypothetical protein
MTPLELTGVILSHPTSNGADAIFSFLLVPSNAEGLLPFSLRGFLLDLHPFGWYKGETRL